MKPLDLWDLSVMVEVSITLLDLNRPQVSYGRVIINDKFLVVRQMTGFLYPAVYGKRSCSKAEHWDASVSEKCERITLEDKLATSAVSVSFNRRDPTKKT